MKRFFLLVILLQLLVSCAPYSQAPKHTGLLAYTPQSPEQSLLTKFQPYFLIEEYQNPYNRIGTPKALLLPNGRERIYVDPNEATVFTEIRKFSTENGTYTNLIYRIHFSKTPFALYPFQLAVGNNVGLLVIVTLDRLEQPILYTTVHTCGCYLAFIPTTYLSQEAYPQRWPEISQVVYSEFLPAKLDPILKGKYKDRLFVMLKHASHRVTDIWLASKNSVENYKTTSITMKPLSELENIPLVGAKKTTSFYETAGNRIGFVKGSHKPLERLLMSWWALDWYIGEDKRLGTNTSEPPIFFTSIKPWARNVSDMRDFNSFLTYWGWKL